MAYKISKSNYRRTDPYLTIRKYRSKIKGEFSHYDILLNGKKHVGIIPKEYNQTSIGMKLKPIFDKNLKGDKK